MEKCNCGGKCGDNCKCKDEEYKYSVIYAGSMICCR